MDDVLITITPEITEVNVTVEYEDSQDVNLSLSPSDSETEAVNQLRDELGDFSVDLLLNYNIAKSL